MLGACEPREHHGQEQLPDLRAGARDVARTVDDEQHAAPADGEREDVRGQYWVPLDEIRWPQAGAGVVNDSARTGAMVSRSVVNVALMICPF